MSTLIMSSDTNTNNSDIPLMNIDNEFHKTQFEWCIWAHLPHDTDWSLASYKNIYTMTSVEETIMIMDTMPDVLIQNCMLFLMRKGVKPTWEDPLNREGGCFSYKISNKTVCEVWKKLCYLVTGGTLSENDSFVETIMGVTISPKKNFCIIKIWMGSCKYQDPSVVTSELQGLTSNGCIFKKHSPEY
jgi:hypothetical protein